MAVLTETLAEAPWLARVEEVKENDLLIVWMEGSYNKSWKPATIIRKGRRIVEWNDTVPIHTVILSGFTLNANNRLAKDVIRLIKELFLIIFLNLLMMFYNIIDI